MLLPGSYRVMMVQGAAVSFPHRVEIPRDLKLSVDLAFEGSVGLQPPLCITGNAEGSAVKLAQLVAAERVVVLRNVAKKGEPPFLSGTVFDLASGKQEREGSVQPELINNLATFLITGKDAMGVQRKEPVVAVAPPPPPPPKKEPEPVVAKKDPEPVAKNEPVVTQPDAVVKRDADVPPPPPPPPPSVSASGNLGARVFSGSLIGLGVASVVAGLIVYGKSKDDLDRYDSIAPMGILRPYSTEAGKEAVDMMPIVAAERTAIITLFTVGVGSAAAGILGLVLFPSLPAQVSFAPTRDGAMLGLTGRF
jgi:hypothetical protein